jgi:hypothetical protein
MKPIHKHGGGWGMAWTLLYTHAMLGRHGELQADGAARGALRPGRAAAVRLHGEVANLGRGWGGPPARSVLQAGRIRDGA